MKLRIRGNSIRLRLTKQEVAEFGAGKVVQESVEFGDGGKLFYRLEISEDSRGVEARFENGRIALRIPKSQAEQWAESVQVSFEAKQKLAGGKELRILVEKDFACLEPRNSEEDADAFPHPSEDARC